jgi:YHS domain-containing protein
LAATLYQKQCNATELQSLVGVSFHLIQITTAMFKHILFFALILCSTFAIGQNQAPNLDKKGVAIEGYDAVSYFKGTPKKGNPSFSAKFNNATYYFESQANLDEFNKKSDHYAPQFNGWCAYALGKTASKVDINPTTYKIINDKLYLFYNSWGNNTLNSWNKDESNLLQNANKTWATWKK